MTNTSDDSLQFDRAEPITQGTAATATCAGCNRAIARTYFEIGGRIFCEECKESVVKAIQGDSRILRFFKALLIGLIAATVCAVGWLLVTKLTGYQFGIIAVVVGAVVGLAVRKGAAGRGGWVYQGMAIVLTYLAIAASYAPDVITAIGQGEAENQSALVSSDKERSRILIHRDGSVKLNDKDSSPEEAVKELERLKSVEGFVMYYRDGRGETDSPASADLIGDKWRELGVPGVYYRDPEFQNIDAEAFSLGKATVLGKLILIGVALFIAVQLPFANLPENAIGLLIIAFALWEAWKINKPPIISITGPHTLAPRPAPAVNTNEPSPLQYGDK